MAAPAVLEKPQESIEQVSTPKPDPFVYGWREVKTFARDGSMEWNRIPLTLEDVLHPQPGDFIVHTKDHEWLCLYLFDVLSRQVKDDPHAVVLHDTRVAWDDPDIRPHGLDLAVIFEVEDPSKDWSTFDVAQEGTRPTLIIEVTSPNYRETDLVTKVDHYEQVGVPFYVIIDTHRRKNQINRRILSYQLTPDGYAALSPDEHGRLWLSPVGLWIGLEGNEVRCYDQSGNVFGDYLQVMDSLEAAEARAEAAEARAEAEARLRAKMEDHIRQMEVEIRHLRGGV